MSYVGDLFAVRESVRNGCFHFPYRMEEVRSLPALPFLISKVGNENNVERNLYAGNLLTNEPLEARNSLHEPEKAYRNLHETKASLAPASDFSEEIASRLDRQTDSNVGLPVRIDGDVRRFFEKAKKTGALESESNPQGDRPRGSSVLFVHFPTEFSLRLFEHYASEARSPVASGQSRLSDDGQSAVAGKPISEKLSNRPSAGFDFVSFTARNEGCAVLRFDDLESMPSLEAPSPAPESFIVLFLDDERIQEKGASSSPASWEEKHEEAKKRLQLLCGNHRRLNSPTVYRVLFPPSRESQDIFISAQLQSLGVDLNAPVSDEMTQTNEALSLLTQEDPADKSFPKLLDDQFVSFIVFEIAAAHKRIDSLNKMIELLSGFDASGWNLLSDALAWLGCVKPEAMSCRIDPSISGVKGVLPFRAEDPLGIEIADRIHTCLYTGSSLCSSIFFEKESNQNGARTITFRETNLFAYAIARWIVRESPYKYLKDKTACLDTFGKLLSSAGFSQEFIGSLVTRSGDCLRTALNRPSLARLNLEHLYDIASQSSRFSLSASDVIALTLRSDCDASGFEEGSCWQNFFMENSPSELQAMAVSNENRFGQVRLGNMKALSAFASDVLGRVKSKVDLAVKSDQEEVFDELECAVWLQMILKDSLSLANESDDLLFLVMLECAVWVDAENVRVPFQYRRSELLSQNTIDRLIGILSCQGARTDTYYFASLALWYYSGFQNGYFIPRNNLKEIIFSACDILTGSSSQIEKASALRVLSTVPFEAFSQFTPNKSFLEKAVIDIVQRRSSADPCCLVCGLLVLSRLGSSPYGSTRFTEMALQKVSTGGHFKNMIVDTLLFETHLRTKYCEALRAYSEGSLEISSLNDVAYLIDHGYAVNQHYKKSDSEKILISLTERAPSLFPIVNLFLHYLQNEEDPEKAFCFYRKAALALCPSDDDLRSASVWWGEMGDFGHPEGLLVSLLLEASGWPIHNHRIGNQEAKSEPTLANALRRIAEREHAGIRERNFRRETAEKTVRRYYGDAVLGGIKSLSPHQHI